MLIRILPQILVNQIAAGEVVERPSSVVKELMENSIDAGSKAISIEIEQGGQQLIRILDNGCGMSAEDARLACTRYATSKIAKLEDLTKINSFGFRGEALAAIASVAQLELKTRCVEDEAGTQIVYRDGKEISNEVVGCPVGTEITVRKLFSFVPARQKYMKKEGTEWRHIVDVVTHIALANPKISFRLMHNGKILFELPRTDDWYARIYELLGRDIAGELVPVAAEMLGMKITGFCGKPRISQSSRKHQYLFVNGRSVNDQTVARAIFDAYKSLLFSRTYPVFLLKIDIEPDLVDVNVHPRKREVKFLYQQDIYRSVHDSVKYSLEHYVLFPKIEGSKPSLLPDASWENPKPEQIIDDMPEISLASPQVKRPEGLNFMKHVALPTIKPLVQLEKSYIVASSEQGVWIIDQHAAHERVMYEKMKEIFAEREKMSQPLLTPLTFEFSRQELFLLEENSATLEGLGFAFEPFGGSTFMLTAVPSLFVGKDMKEILFRIFEDISEGEEKSTGPEERIIRMLACKAAVKFGDSLANVEMGKLLDDLFTLEQNATCPHGRPTMMELSFSELERRFRRK